MAVHDRLEEARADEAPRHAAQADEDAARADGVHLRHEAVVGAEREAEQEQRAEQERAARMERRRKSSFLWLLFSGNILVRESFSGYYRYLIYMAVTFFVSIFVMFTALHLDMKYTRLERSVRLQEQSFRSTTHSAVVRALAERGIPLYDPAAPGEIIEE